MWCLARRHAIFCKSKPSSVSKHIGNGLARIAGTIAGFSTMNVMEIVTVAEAVPLLVLLRVGVWESVPVFKGGFK